MWPFMSLPAKLSRLGSRIFAFVIIPAQLPGDVVELANDLMSDPLATIRSWSPRLVAQLVWQVVSLQKLTIPNDPTLERLDNCRAKYQQLGWSVCPLRTPDGVSLHGCSKAPTRATDGAEEAPRYVIFVGGNMQLYEYWLGYYEAYAQDSGFGFVAFNFRGVGRSEGTTTCVEDMLTDIGTAVEYLLEQGVEPQHILLHGFSIGGALCALYLASDGAPAGVAITSDRSFRTFAHAAYGVCRGFDAAVGQQKPKKGVDSDEEDDAAHSARPSRLRSLAKRGLELGRALVGQLAVVGVKATGWELNAEEAWLRIPGRKVVIYNRHDNIVSYDAASLHAALALTPSLLSDVKVVAVTLLPGRARGWAMHDFPLYFDGPAWYGMIAAEREILGLPTTAASAVPDSVYG